MTKILFICHGNICRSPMAQFVFQNLVEQEGLEADFVIASAATSTEEIGNPVHPGTRSKLREHNISTDGKYSIQLTRSDYNKYDYLIGMDHMNIKNMHRILGGDSEGKIFLLLDFANRRDDIADPWYTGDFEQTYQDVLAGCQGLLTYIKENNNKF